MPHDYRPGAPVGKRLGDHLVTSKKSFRNFAEMRAWRRAALAHLPDAYRLEEE
jgi:hypothetical protein